MENNTNKNNKNDLFFTIWRNISINTNIWGWVKNDFGENYERLFIKKLGYYQLNNIKSFKDYNAMEVLKEKVFKSEYIQFPNQLKAKFFFQTRSFSVEFFKKFIENYRFQLLCQRKLFQNIVVGGNVNALHVFLNEPSTLTRDSLPSQHLELPKWEFQRHKSQLSDCAINIGYIPILKCLLDNNEISVTPGQTLYNNLIANTPVGNHDGFIKKIKSSECKSILKVYDFCIENKFFTLKDFSGTQINYDGSWYNNKETTATVFDYQNNNNLFGIINNIKEYVKFDQFKSPLDLFINLDLYETSFKNAVSLLNIYNYISNNKETNYSQSGTDVDSNLKIKDFQNISITIPLVKKFTEIISRDFKNNLESIRFFYSYLVYSQQLELALEILAKNNKENQHKFFEHSYHFCDLELLKLVRSGNTTLSVNSLIFKRNPNTKHQEKIKYLEYLISEEHTKKLTNYDWYSLYHSLINSNQVELVQYLLNNNDHYFRNPDNELSIKRFSADTHSIIYSFDSFKLIFKYLNSYSSEIIYNLKNSFLGGSGDDDFYTKHINAIDWIINQKDPETGKYYIDRSKLETMDELQCSNLLNPKDKIKLLKYFNENGFHFTYNGLFTRVINDRNFDYFKYLVENTSVSVDPQSTVLSESNWFEAKYYLELKCSTSSVGGYEKSMEYLRRFPISSHPIISNDNLSNYYVKRGQINWDNFINKLKYYFGPDDSDDNNQRFLDWITKMDELVSKEIQIFEDFISKLIEFCNQYDPAQLVKYILPITQWLINHLYHPGLKYIFENYPTIFSSFPSNYHQDQLIKIAREIHSIDLFDLFLNNSKIFPQKSTTSETIETIITELPYDSPLLFYSYYRFPNLNFSIPYKKQDDQFETWKIDWFFKYILKNTSFSIKD